LIKQTLKKYGYSLYAWAILDNHYHIIFRSSSGKYIPDIIREIHSKSAIEINKIDERSGRKVWHQYWDYCIRNEDDYWKHFNYIHQNPVKHRYIEGLGNLEKYPFSSFGEWVRGKSRNWIYECFKKYPIKDFTREEDGY